MLEYDTSWKQRPIFHQLLYLSLIEIITRFGSTHGNLVGSFGSLRDYKRGL